MRKKTNKPSKTSSLHKYVIFSIFALCIFTVVICTIFVMTGGSEPGVLVGCFFGTFGGELFCCCIIKCLQLKTEVKKDE